MRLEMNELVTMNAIFGMNELVTMNAILGFLSSIDVTNNITLNDKQKDSHLPKFSRITIITAINNNEVQHCL